MADENAEVVQTSQETPPANESETTTEVESTTTTPKEESQPEQTSESQEGKPDDQVEQTEIKPTRAERRVDQLLKKLKESRQTASKPDSKPQPFISQEEIEQGGIDPVAFKQRTQELIGQEVQKAIQMDRAQQAYTSAVSEHQADLETSAKDLDPNVEKLAVKQYNALNFQVNPFTGERVFVPAVKLSEIVKDVKEGIDNAVAATTASNREFVSGVDQNSAVPSNGSISSSKKVSEATTNFSDFEKTYGSKKK